MKDPTREEVEAGFRTLQKSIISALEKADGIGKFQFDEWQREGGGGGLTSIIKNGNVIEKGGVNFSAVHGELDEKISSTIGVSSSSFFATGVSIVIHPNNPWVPIVHMNVRYFELDDGTWWFGGGIDLTPHYVMDEDAHFFHRQMKNVCSDAHPEFYTRFKKWADDYFFIKHRKETRGVGGIFFDRLGEKESISRSALWQFVLNVGNTFAPTYTELMRRNSDKEFSKNHKDWQLIRRGRYVEFNLVYDRGTKFGLETDGRIESILMSLPQTAGWEYDHKPEPGSEEESTLEKLRKGIDW